MERKDYRLAAIVYTDIAGFSKMMEKDEAGTLELLNIHNDIVEKAVTARGGTVIKTIGDAYLIDFKNTVDALQCSIDIQQGLYKRNKENPELPLLVRIGLHLGDIYFYENDALGEGINIAARLQSIATPGCICMSGDVYNLVLNKVDFDAEKLGQVNLKNISKEIYAYQIKSPNTEFAPVKKEPVPPPGEKAASQPRGGASTEDNGDTGLDAGEIKRRILLDVKAAGRRLSKDQMMVRYGHSGAVAVKVIEELTEKGILVRENDEPRQQGPSHAGAPYQSGAIGLGKVINDLEYRLEDGIRAAIDQHRGERGRSAQGPHGDWDDARRELKSAMREARHQYRSARRGRGATDYGERDGSSDLDRKEERWDKDLGKSYFKSAADSLTDYDLYAEKVRKEAAHAKAGFAGHLVTYVLVNGFLMTLNATLATGFPWAIFPLGGWGIGVLEHFASVMRKSDRAKELERLPPLDAERLALFKKLQRMKDSIWHHFTSFASVSTFLAAVNLLVSPSFLWFLFPAVGMGIGFFSHLAVHGSKKRQIEASLVESFGMKGSWARALRRMPKTMEREWNDLGPYRSFVDDAANARSAIAAQIGGDQGKKRKKAAKDASLGVDADMLPALDSYVDQVAAMAKKAVEADRIIELIPMEALAKDKANLKAKLAEAPGDSLRREYERSVSEIEKQEKSFAELKEQREVLELRMRSSVNTLKQMRIDMARLSGMDAGGETGSSKFVRDKTAELNRYIQDLKSGYDELDRLEEERLDLSDR